jgi:transposase-like protein
MRYVSWKDLKEFTTDLKSVYKAVTEEAAFAALDEFEVKWGEKYPLAIRSWRVHWTELSTMFKYSPDIRRIIYTTNATREFQPSIAEGDEE